MGTPFPSPIHRHIQQLLHFINYNKFIYTFTKKKAHKTNNILRKNKHTKQNFNDLLCSRLYPYKKKNINY